MTHEDLIRQPTTGGWLSRLVREPLVHFLLLGGLLFGAYYSFNDAPQTSDSNRIVLDEAQVASLAASFQRTWLRLPMHEELAGLVVFSGQAMTPSNRLKSL